jgi:hypothetical protein
MDITITVKIDTDGKEPTVTTHSSGAEAGGGSTGATESDTGSAPSVPEAAAPSADLLARAQAMGASNAGAAPPELPDADGPPAFTGSTPPVAMDQASYEEGLSEGPTDVSAGAAPETGTEDDLIVTADALPAPADAGDDSNDGSDEPMDAGPPRRRAAKMPAKKK